MVGLHGGVGGCRRGVEREKSVEGESGKEGRGFLG